MKVFNYKEDRLPILIITFLFVLDIVVYLSVDNVLALLLWFGIMIWPKGNICAWNHHHQHCNTFAIPFLNRCLEIIYSFQTGITGYVWVLHHNLGHHINYLDQQKDESRWKGKNNKKMNRLRYTFEVALTSYLRAYKVGGKYPQIRKKFLFMLGTSFVLLLALTIYRPIPALLVFWLPGFVSLVLTADATYSHHSGLDTDKHAEASRNIVDSVWYNRLTGNLGYHTAHHMKFGLHWSRLPKLHEKIKNDIPDHCYDYPMVFFRILDKLTIRE